ncbi:MAG TPA: hypothetical protein VKQ72_05000 [Aggregatilineales bacterium]|nr:hypothetical protein [Aggregatilineales bacterium]
MHVASLAELRQGLREAAPGETIELAPGEYQGPFVVETPVTLRGLDRRTVLWRRGGPVVYVRAPGVRLEKLLIERTVSQQGPLVVHQKDCVPTGRESKLVDALINLGELIAGSSVTLPLDLDITDSAQIAVTGLYGAQVTPTTLEGDAGALLWLTLDGKTIQRGEVLLGELFLREGSAVRYVWLSGVVQDAPPANQFYCLTNRKMKLYASPRGLMLNSALLAQLDVTMPEGRYAFIQHDPSGALFLYVPGEPPAPVLLNGQPLPRWNRVPLKEKDSIKIGAMALSVQIADPPPISVDPPVLTVGDFDDAFPEPVPLKVRNGKTAWKGHVASATPWLDVLPEGDFRIPPSRSNDWSIQLNEQALLLPNGVHEAVGALLVVGQGQALAVDARVSIQRPDVALRVDTLDAGKIEWHWPVERLVDLPIGNLGRAAWVGSVRATVPWLELVTPMPMTCGPWSEAIAKVRLTPDWDNLPVGTYALPGAIVVEGPKGDVPVAVRLEVTPARGHVTPLVDLLAYDQVERNAPLPEIILEVRNDGGAPWEGTIRAVNRWVRIRPDELVGENALAPGATAQFEVRLMDVPSEVALDTPITIDEIRIEEAENENAVAVLPVQITIVELPPFLVANAVRFPPFVKGDNPPEGQLRIHNNGPARWRGTITPNHAALTVPDSLFTCEPGSSIDLTVTLNSKAQESLQIGLNTWENALTVSGGREPLSVPVQLDLREPISELHLETPLLNFGEIDPSLPNLDSSQTIRLVNASPAAVSARVELCVPWLSVESKVRAFDLEIAGGTLAEFPVSVNGKLRDVTLGVLDEARAILVTTPDKLYSIHVIVLVNEWSPLLALSPEKLSLRRSTPESVSVRNTGQRPWTLQVIAPGWLSVSPAEFTLDSGQEQQIAVKYAGQGSVNTLSDPRAVVIAGSGREYALEVSVVAMPSPAATADTAKPANAADTKIEQSP